MENKYMENVKYLFRGYTNPFAVFTNFKSLITSSPIARGKEIFHSNTTHLDIQQSQKNIYDCFASTIWIMLALNLVLTVLGLIVSIADRDIEIGAFIGGLFGDAFAFAVMLFLYGLVVTISRKYADGWNMGFVKAVLILSIIGIVTGGISFFWSLCFTNIAGIIKLFGYFSWSPFYAIFAVIELVVNIVLEIVTFIAGFAWLNGILFGRPVNKVVANQNQNNYNSQNGFGMNQQNNFGGNTPQNGYGMNQQNNFGNYPQNGYGMNQQNNFGGNAPQNGFAGNQQNNFGGNVPQNGFGVNNQQGNFGGNAPQNNFGGNVPQNGFGANNQSQQNININKPNTQEQLFACPYCGKPIRRGENPCHNCGNHVNWGN